MLRFALTSLLIILTCIIFLTGIARLALPQISSHEDTIARIVSKSLDRPVTIGSIEARWTYENPEFYLHDVTVLNHLSRQPQISLKRVAVSVDVWQSLKEIRPVLVVGVKGADLLVRRNSSGKFSLGGLENSAEPGADAIIPLLKNLAFNLISSTVRLEDEYLDQAYQLSNVNISFQSGNDTHVISAEADLPDDVGESIKAGMTLSGDLSDLATLEGQLYFNAQRIYLDALPADFQSHQFAFESGVLTTEGWGDWSRGVIDRWVGTLNLNDVRVTPKVADQPDSPANDVALDSLYSRARWKRQQFGWTLDAADLQVETDTREWPRSGFNLEHTRTSETRQLRLAVDYLQLADLAPYLYVYQPDHEIVDSTRQIQPFADITDLRLRIRQNSNKLPIIVASGAFSSLQFSATDDIPGATGLNGDFLIDEKSGEVTLHSDSLIFDYPKLFEKPIAANELKARLRWLQTTDGVTVLADRFLLSNPDISLQGSLGMTMDSESPYVEVQMAVLDGKGDNTRSYVPRILKPKVGDWLRNGIIDGKIKSGTLVFKGRPQDFPFYNDEGQFAMRLSIDQGVLNYRGDWPLITGISGELSMQNESLQFIASEGTVLSTQIESAQVKISDIKRANIRISGKANGPLADLQEYLIKSSRISSEGPVARDITLSGPADLELDLVLPITRKLEARAERSMRGKLTLEDSGLTYKRLDLPFTDITGEFDFDLNGATANNVTALLYQRPVSIDARSRARGRTEIQIQGNFSPQTFAHSKQPIISRIQGSSNWKAVLDLPSIRAENTDKSVGLNLKSDLKGIAVNLPQPFGKQKSQVMSLTLDKRFVGGQNLPFRASYGDAISSVFLFGPKSESNFSLQRAELRVNRGEAVLPEEGITVLAKLDEFSSTQWLNVFQEPSEASPGNTSVVDAQLPLRYLDMDVARLELSGLDFQDFKLKAMRESEAWKLVVDAPAIKGNIEIPRKGPKDQPVIAALDHLVLDLEKADHSLQQPIKPESIPPVRLSSHELRFRNFMFTEVNMETAQLPDGVKLQYLKLKGPDFSGKVNGVWRLVDDQQRSKFKFELMSDDISKTLDSWNVDNSFSDGIATVSVKLNWPYAPHQFDFDGLRGVAHVDIKDGRLKKVKQGAARLLGLFNISTLQRRLSLNFKDIFKKGFVFDLIEGDLRVEDSNVYTDNLRIKGPSALVRIEGRTGLLARDYDQTIKVNPELSIGLPLAGTLVGGPALGAAVLVAEKISEQLGQDVDKLVTLEYKVTGPWDKPEINEIAKEPEHSFAPETSSPER